MTAKIRSLLVLSCLAIGFAFNSFLPGVAAQSGDSFKIRADVDLVTVEVTALDKKGNPARDLKKEDFQLYEDGKKQEILSIDEVNAAAEASPSGVNPISGITSHRGKTVLIVFADNLIKSDDIKTSRDSAERFVQEHMRPQDLFAVAQFFVSMKILQSFTSDRNDVLEAIRNAAGVSVSSMSGGMLLPALDRINHSIAQIKGQKSILIFADPVSYAFMPTDPKSLIPDLSAASRPTLDGVASGNALGRITLGSIISPKSNIISNVVYYGVELRAPGSNEKRIFADLSFFNGTNDAALDKLDQKLSNYYILGFRSSSPKHDGGIRKLEVRTKLSGLTLKYQTGYLDRRPVDALANTKQETTLLTALATPDTATQLPIVFRAAYFYDSPRTAKVLVASRISLEKAAFMKKGAQLGAELRIMGVAYGEDGSIAARFSETLPVSIEKEKEAEFRKRDLTNRNYLRLRPGKYRLKIAVSDESGNLGSMEQMLEVPVLPERGFAGSSLLIAEQASRLPDLISNLKSQMLDENNPLVYAGFQIEPSINNKMPANTTLPVVFRLYNLPGAPDQWNLTAKARIIDERGKEYSLGPIPLKNAMSAEGNAEAAVALSLSFKDVPPGKYRLIVETSEAGSQDTATLQTDFEFAASAEFDRDAR